MRVAKIVVWSIVVLTVFSKGLAIGQDSSMSQEWNTKEARQFDFWIGEWDVNLRAIQKDHSWNDIAKAHVEIYRVLDGKAILELWNSETIKGFSLRYYDAARKKWVLFLDWPSDNQSSFSTLEGSFRHGRGEFFAKRDGVISRYTFCDISPTSLRWDDAYSKNGGKTWTYDWIMEFSRTAPSPKWPTDSDNALTFAKAGTRCRGNETEFDQIASLAGQWQGEVESTSAEGQAFKNPVTARAYRILDGCATLFFLESKQGDKTYRSFSMLTYNGTEKRFEELRMDNRLDSPGMILHGKESGGRLSLAEKDQGNVQTWWQFSDGDGDLKFGMESESEKQVYVLQRSKSETETVKESSLKLTDAINEVCPRSGKPVVASSLTSYRGYTVGFCNQHCRDDFANNIEGCSSDREFFDKIIAKKDK